MADTSLSALERQSGALVGIIIPVFKIGPILSDTLKSLYDQARDGIDLRFVLVIDGCPYSAATRDLLNDYLYGSPFPIEVCFKKNEGVSVARNFGLDRLLNSSPDVEYVLFFDADDLAPPAYIKKSISALQRETPENVRAGWAYADQLQFGAASQWVRYPRFILNSRFTVNNVSQPTSLVTRELIDAGVRFDENLKAGIEDWEFWFSAATAGFEGAYVPDSYIKYRRLAGSRSSVNRANDAYTKFYLRTKHANSYKSRSLLQKEYARAPRYAFWNSQAKSFLLDSVRDEVSRTAASIRDVTNSLLARWRYQDQDAYIDAPYFPDLIVIGYIESKGSVGMLFNAERQLIANGEAVAGLVVGVNAVTGQENPKFLVLRASRVFRSLVGELAPALSTEDGAKIAAMKDGDSEHGGGKRTTADIDGAITWRSKLKSLLGKLAARQQDASTVVTSTSMEPKQHNEELVALEGILGALGPVVKLAAPGSLLEGEPGAIGPELDNLISSVRSEIYFLKHARKQDTPKKENVVGNHRATHWKISQEAIGVKHVYPWLPQNNKKSLLGVVGSPEEVSQSLDLINILSQQRQDMSIHWFVPSNSSALPELIDTDHFDAVTLLIDSTDDLIKKPGRYYNGVPLWERADHWNALVADALSSCDYVLNVGFPQATLGVTAVQKVGLQGAYFYVPRSLGLNGVQTVSYTLAEHLVAYLGVYTKIIIDCANSAQILRGLGIPRSKLMLADEFNRNDVQLIKK